MPRRSSTLARYLSLTAAGLATSFVGACANDANYARDLAIAAGVTGGEPRPAPDFVSRTRPSETDYVPVGTNAPKRRLKAKTADEIKGAEQDLDRTRAATQAKGNALKQETAGDQKPAKQ